MKRTALKQQIKDPSRVNVFIDGRFKFSLTLNQLLEAKLKSGLEIDQQTYQQLEASSKIGLLIQRCFNYCLMRPRFESELKTYLIKKSCSPEEIEVVSQAMRDRNLLDDEKAAYYWIENRMLKKGISFRRLTFELSLKGVDKQLIDKLLRESPRDEMSEINKVLAKKYNKYERTQLLRYLVGRGFSYDIANQSIADYEDNQGSI